jgi:endonuclease/exonuclease/phosphatase (EEP) superfamily protein YafD
MLRNGTNKYLYPRPALRVVAVLSASFLLTSCATIYVDELSESALKAEQYDIDTETGVGACRTALSEPKDLAAAVLDASNIRLVNWNIRKQLDPESDLDLASLSNEKDLILIQEASLREETINNVDASKHWSFAPGYRTSGAVSGVLTLSSIKPITQCSFVSLEPILRSPKATSITEYALSSTEQTLVVVNMHAVNFSTGLKAFRNQFQQVSRALRDHRGPIIFSGDLNTWRKKRIQIVEDFAETLGLDSIDFGDDHRVTVFGNILDHIYVRGLSTVYTRTDAVETSDHNPMSATFSAM